MSEPFLERLRQGPLLCDGAMGTVLYARAPESIVHGRCFDELVLTDPGLVQEIHRDYIRAGAQIIETNTFGANAVKLAGYGLAEKARLINRRATELAREARDVAGQEVFVAGAVGPTGQLNIPQAQDDDPRLVALREAFREQIEALVERGVDLLILETFANLTELRQAALAAREVGSVPLVAQVTFGEEGQMLSGTTPAAAALSLARLDVDVLGVNCSIGPAGTLDALDEMRDALHAAHEDERRELYLSVQPNAGLPARVENRFLYYSTPRYFADYAQRFAEAGARIIGGCCGTTPAHIEAMRGALTAYLPAQPPRAFAGVSTPRGRVTEVAAREPLVEAAGEGPSATRLQRALHAGEFAVCVELDPPKGLNPTKILDGAAYLREIGVEFINIADSPMARVRMSCMSLARLLQERLDVESIIHFTTRDRNLMAIQSDLLGAHALGIHNILALTGDPVRVGNYPNLTGVWDVDSVGLIGILREMNEGRDAAGASLGMPASFHVGAALNLNMEDEPINLAREQARRKLVGDLAEASAGAGDDHATLTETELELHRLRHKLDAGAQYIMTQPIYSIEPLERFNAAFGPVNVPMLLGVMPLHSSKHAEYLHNEVPGISVPEEVRERMREAGERGREVGIELARDVIVQARERGLIQGCYLAPSYGRFDLVGDLARELLRVQQVGAGR
jgi:methionine synthase / methylenetetrahydrofolate reductase(NADPH)